MSECRAVRCPGCPSRALISTSVRQMTSLGWTSRPLETMYLAIRYQAPTAWPLTLSKTLNCTRRDKNGRRSHGKSRPGLVTCPPIFCSSGAQLQRAFRCLELCSRGATPKPAECAPTERPRHSARGKLLLPSARSPTPVMRGSGGNTVCPRGLLRSAGYYARGCSFQPFSTVSSSREASWHNSTRFAVVWL